VQLSVTLNAWCIVAAKNTFVWIDFLVQSDVLAFYIIQKQHQKEAGRIGLQDEHKYLASYLKVGEDARACWRLWGNFAAEHPSSSPARDSAKYGHCENPGLKQQKKKTAN